MEDPDNPLNHPHLSVVPTPSDSVVELMHSNEDPFQLRKQQLDIEEKELQLQQKQLDIKKQEIELQRLLSQNELDIRHQKEKLEFEIKKLEHGLTVDKFQRTTKALMSLLGIAVGIYFHFKKENIGYFLIGAGLGGFGITMANSGQASIKIVQDEN